MNECNRTKVDPKEIVTEFIEEKLAGSPMDLIDFDFYGKLEYNRSSNDYKFSEMTSLQDVEDRDPDDYQIVRAIMYLIWNKKLPELKFEDIGTGKKYRGDTLNTYRSLFGRDLSVQKKYGFDDRLTKKVKTFRKKYLTIGNFILLPNKSVKSFTLNAWRGSASGSRWFDYFDQFLIELDKCFNREGDRNDILNQLLHMNNFYFNNAEIKDLHDFVQLNFLSCYIENGTVIHRFPEKLYHWWRESPSKEECQIYRDFAERFIDESSKLIQFRSNIMLSELQKAL